MLTAEKRPIHEPLPPASRRPPIRVLFLNACVRGGGANWSLYYLLKHLDRSRIDPVVVLPDAGALAGRFESIRVRPRIDPRLPERLLAPRFRRAGRWLAPISILLNAVGYFRAWRGLVRFIRSERVDLIYCNHMFVKPLGALAGQVTGTPVVLHCRTIYQTLLRRKALTQIARLPVVKRVVCISKAAEQPYRFSRKTAVVPNGVDLDEYDPDSVTAGSLRAELNLGADTAIVGYLGRLVSWKGIDVLLDAARIVLRHNRRCVFCVVGDNRSAATRDAKAEYQRQALRLGLERQVRFLGFREDVRPCLRDFDLLALPSKSPEPFGRVNIEAMAMGVPVIATAHGGPLDILEDGVDGFLVPPGDPGALARKILSLIASPEMRRQVGERARRKVCERFNAADVAGRIEAIIREAAQQAKKTA